MFFLGVGFWFMDIGRGHYWGLGLVVMMDGEGRGGKGMWNVNEEGKILRDRYVDTNGRPDRPF